jgi:hypothetical protein
MSSSVGAFTYVAYTLGSERKSSTVAARIVFFNHGCLTSPPSISFLCSY